MTPSNLRALSLTRIAAALLLVLAAALLSASGIVPGTRAFAATDATDTAATATSTTGKYITKHQVVPSVESYTKSTLTRDSDGFFATLSSDGKATFNSKISLSDLSKIGISGGRMVDAGKGSYKSPVKSGSTNGAKFSYQHLYVITIDNQVFDQAAKLSYVNNNGVTVSYNKRDTIQAVLYAIGKATQADGFDGKTMYQVNVDYNGTIDLTNELFIYSNTWLKLGSSTVLKKEYQSSLIQSDLADRTDADNRRIDYTDENLLRNTAAEYRDYGYRQCRNIIIEGGTWDANIAQYNSAKLGDTYQSSLATFTHMKNLVVQNTTMLGANLAHHLELAGVRDVSVTGCRFSQDDGYYACEAIQIECLHSKGATRESTPYDDTICRDVVIYNNTFDNLSRGVGNHSTVLGYDSSRIFVYRNTFTDITSQAVLTCGCRTMRIEENTMQNVGTGVDVRVTWEDGPLNLSLPHDDDWTYQELVDDGFMNRNIKVLRNTIASTDTLAPEPLESLGMGIYVKGQILKKADLGDLKKAAGTYTITGVTLQGNTISSAVWQGIHLAQTKGVSVTDNTVGAVALSKTEGRGDGLYAVNSANLAITGNSIAHADGWGMYLAKKSAGATIEGNKVTLTTTKQDLYAAKSSVPSSVSANRFTTAGTYASNVAGQKTRAATVKAKTNRSVSGTTAPSVKITAYAGKKKLGSARSDAKGSFSITFKKKVKANASVELRYKDGSANNIRFTYQA